MLNDGGFERDALEARNMDRHVSRGRGKISAIVAGAVSLASFVALVAGSRGQLLRLLLQQFVERLFHTATDQFFELALDYFLV